MRDNTVFVFLFILSALPVAARRRRVIVAEEEWGPEQQMCRGPGQPHLSDVSVPWGVPGRAYLTVPPEVEIVPSKMPNAGLGVVSKTLIPKYAWLGEYEGLTVLPHENQISAYAWSVNNGFERQRHVDAGNVETSNWFRFINAPRNVFQENLVVRECFDKLSIKVPTSATGFSLWTDVNCDGPSSLKTKGSFTPSDSVTVDGWHLTQVGFNVRVVYQTSRDISPGQELLVHYGDQYAGYMGIWEEYNFSLIVNHISKHLETKVKDVRRIFKVLHRTIYPEDRCLNSNAATTVLAEARHHLMMIMGQEF